jgi:hypothetical protein
VTHPELFPSRQEAADRALESCTRPAAASHEAPCLSLATALPLSVWQDHLSPLLSVGEAARLRVVCKALRGVVKELPVSLGWRSSKHFEAALTCFPSAQSLHMSYAIPRRAYDETISRMVDVLRRHGGTLKRVMIDGDRDDAQLLLSHALRSGALPKLRYFRLSSEIESLELLVNGLLDGIEVMDVCFPSDIFNRGGSVYEEWDDWDPREDVFEREERRAARERSQSREKQHKAHMFKWKLPVLKRLRKMPLLRTLSIQLPPRGLERVPPFIPPSLKELTITRDGWAFELSDVLICQLPSIVEASGARLERVNVSGRCHCGEATSREVGAALDQVLRTCSPTLKEARIMVQYGYGSDFTSELAPGLMSCCEGPLERLEVGWGVFGSLPPTCPGFTRLTHLTLNGGQAMDLESALWGLMASGRLPTLASLRLLGFGGIKWDVGAGDRLAHAFSGVAGTLKHLTLDAFPPRRLSTFGALTPTPEDDLPESACCELGAALGQLKRLKYLSLGLFWKGRSYHAVARGLAASGGLPRLFELDFARELAQREGWISDIEWLTCKPSLIVPSVKRLAVRNVSCTDQALLLFGGLAGMGYKHHLTGTVLQPHAEFRGDIQACTQTVVMRAGSVVGK